MELNGDDDGSEMTTDLEGERRMISTERETMDPMEREAVDPTERDYGSRRERRWIRRRERLWISIERDEGGDDRWKIR
uniref:Uncharacterized protein n=1 Tax=Brassica campestris TaxID=3711 RepID=M4C9P3_BRACM